VVTNACAFYHCTRGCGCAKHPAFPAPSAFEGETNAKLGQILPRERGVISFSFLLFDTLIARVTSSSIKSPHFARREARR
jgi:hypothetical protein